MTHILQKSKKISFSIWLSLGTFVTATFLFILYLIYQNDGILYIGVFYTLFTVLLNIIMLIFNVNELLTLPNERKEIIIKILILLANIPIAFFFLYVIGNLMFLPKG